MSIIINATLTTATETSFEVTDRELDVMVARGVDVTDEYAVGDFYRAHVGEDIAGVSFASLFQIADDQHTKYKPEIEEWSPEGEAPERFWPAENDSVVAPS